MFRLGMGEVFRDYVVGRAPPGPGGLSTECLQTMENDSQKRVPTRRKKAPVAEPKVQRPEWVGYHENYVETHREKLRYTLRAVGGEALG